MNQELNIVINAQDRTKEAFNSSQSAFTSFKSKVEDMKPTFQRMATAGTVAFGAISAIAYKSVTAYADVEKANRQLEHAVLAVSKGTKAQVDEIKKLTNALQDKAGVDADSLNMGVAQLSTFGLQSKSVISLTKSLADLTVNQNGLNATSDQYISSANIIAKAMRGEFGMLEKMGIRFTEAQQKMIEFGTESQKVSAINEGLAQNLRETTDTVGGVDLAMAKAKRSMEDMQEGIGKALAPAFNKVLETITPLLQKFTAWAEKNPELLGKIILIAGAVAGLVAVLGTLGLILPPIIAFFALLTAPVLVVIGIIVALGVAIYSIIGIFNILKNDSALVWEGIKITINEKITAIKNAITTVLNTIKNVWTTVWGAIRDFFSDIWNSIVNTAQTMIGKIKNFLQPVIDMVDKVISKLASIGQSVGGSVKSAISKIGSAVGINDGIVQNGQVITTHPDDYIIATKTPESLGGKGNITVNILGGNYLDEYAAEKFGDIIISKLQMQMRGS